VSTVSTVGKLLKTQYVVNHMFCTCTTYICRYFESDSEDQKTRRSATSMYRGFPYMSSVCPKGNRGLRGVRGAPGPPGEGVEVGLPGFPGPKGVRSALANYSVIQAVNLNMKSNDTAIQLDMQHRLNLPVSCHKI